MDSEAKPSRSWAAAIAVAASLGLLALAASFTTRPDRRPAMAEKNWLLIGDSHSVMTFGDSLRETLFESGVASPGGWRQWSVSGSTARSWLSSEIREIDVNCAWVEPGRGKTKAQGKAPANFKPFRDLLESASPDAVIVALGTNDLARVSKAEARESALSDLRGEVARLLAPARGRECYWVLPPTLVASWAHSGLQSEFEKAVVAEVEAAGCVAVRSRDVATADNSDGVHALKATGARWGKEIGRRIAALSNARR